MRIILISAIFIIPAISMSIPLESLDVNFIPPHIKDLIPSELLDFLKSVTPEEKKDFVEFVFAAKNFTSNEEYLEEFKKRSPSLFEKAEKFGKILHSKYEKLDPTVQSLIKKSIVKIRELHKEYVNEGRISRMDLVYNEFVPAYMSLSEEAKGTIAKEFPFVIKLSQNEQVKYMLGQFIGEQDYGSGMDY